MNLLEQIDAWTAITISDLRQSDGKMLGIELDTAPGRYRVIGLSSNTGDTGWHIILHDDDWYALDMMDNPRASGSRIEDVLDALEKERVQSPEEFGQ